MKYFLCVFGGVLLGALFSSIPVKKPTPPLVENARPYVGITVKHPKAKAIADLITTKNTQPLHWYPCGDHLWLRIVLSGPDAPFLQFWEGNDPT